MEQFKSSDTMKNYTTFVFNDETRFGCEQDSFTSISDYQDYQTYKYWDYVERSPQYVITIEKGSYELDYVNLFRLMLDKHFDRDSFDRDFGNIVKLE